MDEEEEKEEVVTTKEHLHELIEQFLIEEVLPEGLLEDEEMAGTFIIGMTPNSLNAMLHNCFDYIEDTMFAELKKEKETKKVPKNATIH